MIQRNTFDPLILPNIPPKSRILVADAWDITPHLETGLEIALRLAASYSRVDYVNYGDILPACESLVESRKTWLHYILNINHRPVRKGIHVAKKFAALYGLNLGFLDPFCCRLPDCDSILEPVMFESLDSLNRACFYGSNTFGISLVSSLVSLTRNSLVNPSDHKKLVEDLATGFARCFYLIGNLLSAGDYDAIVVFNGRFASVKGAVLAAKHLSIPSFFHERGCSMEKFWLRDYQPHDRVRFQADMRDGWLSSSKDAFALSMAKDFFESKRVGKERGWVSFKDRMVSGASHSIISNIKSKTRSKHGKIICFFSSSEDEYVSTEGVFEVSGFEWKSQENALIALASAAFKYGHSLVIRNHPHLQSKAFADRSKWDDLEFIKDHTHLTLIKSDSSVDTYELIDLCDLVVVYGSTVGIEALYWNKPVVVMSDTLYDEIGSSIYKPLTVDQLDNLISNIDRLLVDPLSCLPYGYYMSTFGISHQLYSPVSLFSGNFIGVNLARRSLFHRGASRLKKAFKGFGRSR
jgi:hypothetical protein